MITHSQYVMPGEHHAQDEVWMAWPHRPDNWRDNGKPVQAVFVELAIAIAQFTPVTVIVSDELYRQARKQLPNDIEVLKIASNDCWMRDIGATYVINNNGQRRGISWQFNAWGGTLDGLYDDWTLDNAVAKQMTEVTGDSCDEVDLILEGGSIHCDGDGTLYTTEECLLHPSRNPQLSKSDIERQLKEILGVEKIIWLTHGLFNDETNGHIDNILHVVKPGEVLLTVCDDPTDPQYAISQQALSLLQQSTDAKGRKIKVHALPMPGPLYLSEQEAEGIIPSSGMVRQAGERLAASYANFLISNGGIIFPLLDEKHDAKAQSVLQAAFPNHQLVGLNCREILLGGGNIHCMTQHVPSSANDSPS
ncbi:agmatine deiminase [Reinekea thalattae]|nr:agmatine deiminase [Reinekea thalattae]